MAKKTKSASGSATKLGAKKKAPASSTALSSASAKSSAKTAGKVPLKAAAKSAAKTSLKPQAKSAQKPAAKPLGRVPAKPAPKTSPKAVQKSGGKTEVKVAAKAPANVGSKSGSVGNGKSAPVKATAVKSPPVAPEKAGGKKAVGKSSADVFAKVVTDAASSKVDKVGRVAKGPSGGVKVSKAETEDPLVPSTLGAGSDSPDQEDAAVELEAAGAPGEKAEKKKRKDDLKIDRTGNFEAQWKVFFDKSKALKAVPYRMSENYEARTALLHKVLGWGFVISSQNNRLEVLFKDGIKILIANYKA